MGRMSVGERRSALVAAAFTVIATRGLPAASIRTIVAEAGMSLASFHYAFTSREELLDVLIAETTASERSAVLPGQISGHSLHDLFAEGLGGYLEHLRARPEREQAMLELTQYAVRSRPDLAREQYGTYQEIALATLELVAAETGCQWLVPAPTVARLLVYLTDGLTIGWLVDRDTDAARATIEAAARALSTLART